MTPLMKTVKGLFSDQELRKSFTEGKELRSIGLTSEEKMALKLSRPVLSTNAGKLLEVSPLGPWL